MAFNTYVTTLVVLTLAGLCYAHHGSINLTDSNFHSLTRTGNWLVLFYMPWCKHSRHLLPVYEKLAHLVHTNGRITISPWSIGKVDCDTEKRSDYATGGYPTVSAYVNGKFGNEFDGEDDVVSI